MNSLSKSDQHLELMGNYKLLVENAIECIWLFDLTNKCFKYISPSIISLRGLTVEEALKENLEDCLTPESIQKLKTQVADRLSSFLAGDRRESTISSIDEYQYYCQDRTIKTIEISTKLLLNKETNSIDLLGVSRDVTQRGKYISQSLLGDFEKNLEAANNHIYCFGKFLVYGEDSNSPVKWRTSKSEELFAYFLHNNGAGMPKWEICEALWPEYRMEKISIHLHTTLYKMKNTLNSAKIKFDITFRNGCYWMNLFDMHIDIVEFDPRIDVDIIITKDTLKKYEKLFLLYKNNYLEGNDYIWCIPKRQLYSEKYCKLANSLAHYYMQINNYDKPERFLLGVLEKFPLDESSYEMLLKLYFIKKDRVSFILHYNAMQKLFKSELGIEPSAAMQALYSSMNCS